RARQTHINKEALESSAFRFSPIPIRRVKPVVYPGFCYPKSIRRRLSLVALGITVRMAFIY
ncbi:MAG: hypothetical protein RR413_10905, partial [Christensenellaceae bacterium]